MVELHPIGIIRTPFNERQDMPIQPKGAEGVKGIIELDPPFEEGLKDLDGFSHIILIYQFHLSDSFSMTVTPFMDSSERGLFSTRAPNRPNPIGLSIVRLISVQKHRLEVEGIDVVDQTPLLDIKPYIPSFDRPEGEVREGWIEKAAKNVAEQTSDNRFISS